MAEFTEKQIKAAAIAATIYHIGYTPKQWEQFKLMAEAMFRVAASEELQNRELRRLD